MAKISVIGSGISGLAAASFMAQQGHSVSIFEKNDTIGGRARHFSAQGFMFDMGPSWYWMPDVFENFFKQFGKTPADYYSLVQLDPGFRMYFGKGDTLDISADPARLEETFESIEKGSAAKLRKYLADAQYKYNKGMLQLAHKPSVSWTEFAHPGLLIDAIRLSLFTPISKHVRNYFRDPRLIALMEFPVLFLGAMPWQVPAMYSLMNHAAITQGTWYPMGGMCKIIEGMSSLAQSLGVRINTSSAVEHIDIANNIAGTVRTSRGAYESDAIIAACDYNHLEQTILDEPYRNYSEPYWDKRTLAPSCLIFYVGVDKKVDGLIHHNLFFDTDLNTHAKAIYEQPEWPDNPLFYVCCPSKTDDSVAPAGHENLFFLIPIAPGLTDTRELHDRYFNIMLDRVEHLCGTRFRDNIVYKRAYSVSDFTTDYNAYKGNAYGLANTLSQTAMLKPSIRNKKVANLFYAGQLTVPGPGVPPAFISGQIAAGQALKHLAHL